VMCKDWAATRD